MKRIALIAALLAALNLATTGCANMTPEQQNAAAAAFIGGMAGLAIGAAAARPTYYAPPAPRMRMTDCTTTHWGGRANTSCTSY